MTRKWLCFEKNNLTQFLLYAIRKFISLKAFEISEWIWYLFDDHQYDIFLCGRMTRKKPAT